MGDPYVGEIRMFGGNYAPSGWALCNGQVLDVNEHPALFALIGTTYGGDGHTTFRLPDLRGRIPVHKGALHADNYTLGQKGGAQMVNLTTDQLPPHTHQPLASSKPGETTKPEGAIWAAATGVRYLDRLASTAPMHQNALGQSGGNRPHDNMAPYQAVHFIISLHGLYPTQD